MCVCLSCTSACEVGAVVCTYGVDAILVSGAVAGGVCVCLSCTSPCVMCAS